MTAAQHYATYVMQNRCGYCQDIGGCGCSCVPDVLYAKVQLLECLIKEHLPELDVEAWLIEQWDPEQPCSRRHDTRHLSATKRTFLQQG